MAVVDTSELVKKISGEIHHDIAVDVTLAPPKSYANQWWSFLGADARTNATLVANHLDDVLGEDLHDFRRVVRENSWIAPVNVTRGNGDSSAALLYCIVEEGRGLEEWDYNHYCLGFEPASPESLVSAGFHGAVGGAFDQFYSQVHDGFAVDVEFDGGWILPVANIVTWKDQTSYDSPEDIQQSLLGDEPYVPDPNQMAIVWKGNGDVVFALLDGSAGNWQYAGGSFFYYSDVSKSGRRITPMVLIEQEILHGYLDYDLPMPYK